MNNEQIIYQVAIGVYGEENVEKMIAEYGEVPLHTLKGWNMRGNFMVKKGEKGIECRLWKKNKRKGDEEKEHMEENQDSSNHNGFYLCKSYLFHIDQVERGKG